MRDDGGVQNSRNADSDDGLSRLFRSIKMRFFGLGSEQTLRSQLEEAIEEHDESDSTAEGVIPGARNKDLSPLEREMLRNLLNFGDLTADDVAVPRADIIAIDEKSSFDAVVAAFADAGHSRLPVYRENLDHIIGMIHIKDVFYILATGKKPPKTLRTLIRQPRYVPQSMGVLDLLAEMRTNRTHLAIVVDEYSGTDGIVTIEDLIEEIVGEIEDEHDDAPTEAIVALTNGAWDVDARTELEDVAAAIDPALAEVDEDVDTIGGLSAVLAGHVPQRGEMMEHFSGWRIEILAGDTRRVTRVRLHPPHAAQSSGDR
jgi:CBS domain containing-hemolysin-like protein